MTWRTATEYLIIANVVLVALYDVAARVWGGPEATISVVLYDATRAWPVIALAAGAIVAHIWWPV